MKRFVLLALLLFIPLSFAANFDYVLTDNKVLTEIELEDSEWDYLEVPNNIDLLDFKENGDSVIKFTTRDFIEKSGPTYFFISSNELHKNSSIKVLLPEGATLTDNNLIFPKGYEMSTDGYHIILRWNNPLEKDILINYKIEESSPFWIYFFIIVLAGVIYLYFKFLYDKKNYSKNLFREEKMIIEYLEKKKECWTKELVRDLGISKVKLSRKIRSLEEKGLIKKEPHGNENRIKLVK